MGSRVVMRAAWAACLVIVCCASAAAGDWRGEVDALFARWDSPDSPGVMLAIAQDGEIVHARGFGTANLEKGIPIGADSLFNVASVSKQFTAASVALLVLDGKLSLDDDIRKFLPYLPEYDPKITVRHLVHHTSGIPDVFGEIRKRKIKFRYPFGNQDALPVIATAAEPHFPPGEKFRYSNSNYVLLAEIVHKVSGRTLREFTGEHIFGPLGMVNTRVDDNLERLDEPNMVTSYRKRNDKFQHTPRNDYMSGDGNVVTSVVEMARWSQNFHTHKVGGREFVELILTPGVLNSGEKIEYAFGIMVGEFEGRRRYSHGGSWLGFRSHWSHFPDEGTTILVFCNHGKSERHQNEVARIYFAARDGESS